jgi:hypothetical protein
MRYGMPWIVIWQRSETGLTSLQKGSSTRRRFFTRSSARPALGSSAKERLLIIVYPGVTERPESVLARWRPMPGCPRVNETFSALLRTRTRALPYKEMRSANGNRIPKILPLENSVQAPLCKSRMPSWRVTKAKVPKRYWATRTWLREVSQSCAGHALLCAGRFRG